MLLRDRKVFAADDDGAGGGAAGAAGGAGGVGAAGGGAAGAAEGGAGNSASVGGGAAPVAFADSLPADIREDAVFRDIKDLAGLAKSYQHAQKLIGRDPKDVLVLPAPDDEAAISAIYDRLGRPEAADKYQLTAPALAEGMQIDTKLQTGFQDTAHKIGLSNKQADALYQWYNSQASEMLAASSARDTQSEEAAVGNLKTEWGVAFAQNVELAQNALAHYGTPGLIKELETPGPGGIKPGNSPELMKTFAKLGRQLSEDGVIGKGGGGSAMSSPTEARQQINALRGDKAFMSAYMSAKAPGHADAVEKMRVLHEQAYPAG